MIIDFRRFDKDGPIETDLCVVGAGAAGISIALGFVHSPISVCLVESGGFTLEAATQSLYEGEIVGLPYVDLDACRLRMFGGTTNHWGGWSAPYEETDFERRDWVPYSGWPVTRADLEPFYRRAQELCGLGPFVYDESVWRELHIAPDPPDRQRVEVAFIRVNQQRFGTVYRRALEVAPNVTVLHHANVVGLAADETASALSHLEIRSLTGRSGRVTARAYVLACGGIENARLLLNSDQVQSGGLGNQHDLVGRFFMDHPPMDWPPPAVRCAKVFTTDPRSLLDRFGTHDRDGKRYVTGLRLPSEVQRSRRVLNCCGWLNQESDPAQDASQLDPEADARIASMLLRMGSPELDADAMGKGAAAGIRAVPAAISLVSQSEQAPNPDSRVTLSHERDALGLRRVRLNWQMTDLDKRSVRVWAELVGAELSRLDAGRVRLEDWLVEDSGRWPSDLQGAWHHIGTTRMGSDPKQGVVDRNCKVHGLDNLYVAGCSIFPTSGWVNPTLTIVAFAVRLAEHLRLDRRSMLTR